MGANFWPVFVTVAALSSAVVWKFSPEVGRKLSPSVRDAIRGTVRHAPAATPAHPMTDNPTADVQAPSPKVREKPAVQSTTPRGEADGAREAVVAGVTDTQRKQDGKKPKAPGAVTPSAQNPTGSPYLEPAAKALREYKRLLADFERKQKGMNIAAQRAAMKKLHETNARVEFLNQKHREWKQSHPAASGLAR